jgi:hypothetical protein
VNVPNILGSTKQEFSKGNCTSSVDLLEETFMCTDAKGRYLNEREGLE